MTWTQTTRERIVAEAAELAPLKVLITILAAPFFVIGALVGLVWIVGALAWQAAWVGTTWARSLLHNDGSAGGAR